MSTRLLASRKGNILLLSLDADNIYPRLESTVLDELAHQVEGLAAAPDFGGAVISGSDRAFSAGAEISELNSLTPGDAFRFARKGQGVFREIARLRKPVVAAIRGLCMGGGLDLALACHHRIATADAVFAHPGGGLGILTGWGGTQRLPRLIGRSRAMEMLATGSNITAQEALDGGLISNIAPAGELLQHAVELARKHAEK